MWAVNQIASTDRVSLVRDARDYALLNGLVLRYDSMTNDNCVAHIPFTLFPSPYPKQLYQECLDIQPIVNKLMFKIATDSTFIVDTLGPIATVDEFTRNLLDVNEQVSREGLAQTKICCISRADYMLDKKPNSGKDDIQVRQVEVNAIASGMSAHSCNVKSLQDFIMSKYDIKTPNDTIIPDNKSLSLVVQGLIDAFEAYGKPGTYILLVAEKRSLNFSDQILIERELLNRRPDIKFVRRSFYDLPGIIKLGPNKELILDECKEIALVYFRYCYDPSNYSSNEAWAVRLLLERSKAIKCPSINFHLSGAKKFQQVLNSPKQLERFLTPADSLRLSKIFCKFWSFDVDNPTECEGYKLAIAEANALVLKPQREGGGHNIFGKDIKPFVEQMVNTDERSQYILMEYIEAPREENWLLVHTDNQHRDRVLLQSSDQLVSELGIFGSILADSKTGEIKTNESAGYLVRSKKFGVNEGGVSAGYAGISNLMLHN